MLITAIGTIWECFEDKDYQEHACARYSIELSETIPGTHDKEGEPQVQPVRLSLESAESFEEGVTYQVTARVRYITPTQEGEGMLVMGTVVEAKRIE